MNNIKQLASEGKKAFFKRFEGVMYGTFTISWAIWNWQAIYTSIFVSEETILQLYNTTKIAYIISLYELSTFSKFLFLALGPLVSTYVIIWHIPKLELLCYRKNKNNHLSKEIENLNHQNELLRLRSRVLEAKKTNFELKKELSDEEKWKLDYDEINSKIFLRESLASLEECLYKSKGIKNATPEFDGFYFSFPPEELAFLDANNLTEISNELIKATAKGKHFLKLYLDEVNTSHNIA